LPNHYPAFLSWLPGNKDILIYKDDKTEAKKLVKEADIIFCLDFNTLRRLESLFKPINQSNATKVLIDHHPQPDNGFAFMISQVETSSTSELIYNFICELGDKSLIDKDIAECLYTGIITDTGSYSYNCNYENTYLISAELIKIGVDGEYIHRLVYDTYSEDRMRLLGYCLSKKLKVLKDLYTAYIFLTKEELQQFNFQVGDTEGVVNYALAINGIHFAVLITEKENFIRLSFRSKGDFSVNSFARKYFEGGGHKNAAGGNSYLAMDQTVKKLEELLVKYKDQIKDSMMISNS